MDTQRIIALAVFSFSGLLLWQAWQKHGLPPPVPQIAAAANQSAGAVPAPTVPTATGTTAVPSTAPLSTPAAAPAASGKRVTLKSDTLTLVLDSVGGDIRNAVLNKHLATKDAVNKMTILQDKVGHYFIAQSGLLGGTLPNHTANWTIEGDNFDIGTAKEITATMTNTDSPGVTIKKLITLKRGSYVADVKYEIKNDSAAAINPSAYFQFLRDGNSPEGENTGSNPFTGVVTFTGPAIYTEAKKFQKVDFSDIEKQKTSHEKQAKDGWIGMVQHYFVSAWLPAGNTPREFFTKKVDSTLYMAGVIVPVGTVAPGASASLTMPLYVGPQEQEELKKLAPGLELVVDYGMLTVLAKPMFLVLSAINDGVPSVSWPGLGNWGWTIIVFTILLKIVFFPLNQKAGKSIAQMKLVAPKMEELKKRFGDDRVKLNQAMMEMYKTEKINPLGGCLPMVIQIPFFISLYWVLLSAVELRNAPWMGWIQDLSTPDPWYLLPIIMGASMIVQTRLQPTPADPIQAKVMMMLPIVFSVMFFFFPAGLVLYWTMQNLLGIAQQQYINKTYGAALPVKTPKR